MTAPTVRPPWLQPGSFCGIGSTPNPALLADPDIAPVAAELSASDWATAREICTGLDGLQCPDTHILPTELRLRTWESAWVAYDLLATPRVRRTASDHAATVPAEGAVLPVTDSFGRRWRLCWRHESTRYTLLTAVAEDNAQAMPVRALPRAWFPLRVDAPRTTTMAETEPTTEELAAGWNAWVCPPWCQLPAGHSDWRHTETGMVRTHRAAYPLTSNGRTVTLVLTVPEYADDRGITWGERDIQLADTVTASIEETALIHSLTRHLGAVLRVAALPLPGRLRTVGDLHLMTIPAELGTPTGVAAYHFQQSRARTVLADRHGRTGR
ncbi:hypothetical protein [Nocardia sp. NPDC051570]|uniref:hypothetical protein n=1 Tax=Nocardia sp. NPDC051570 TaxID=3364324 RepID=UPI0037B387DE